MNWIVQSSIAFVAAFLAVMILCRVLVIFWTAALSGTAAIVEVVSQALTGLLRQIGGIVMYPVHTASAAAWRPVQARLDRASSRVEPPSASSDDGYREALEILGLKEHPTQMDVERRHMELLRAYHPETNGTQWIASRVSGAKAVIFRKHGWS